MRKPPNLSTKLAAALLQLRDDETGQPLIEWRHAQNMSATQINSLFQFDHYPIRHEAGGPSEAWNLVPRMIREHRVKTAKIDVPQAAKIKRISREQEAFRQRLLAKDRGEEKPKSRWTTGKGHWPTRKTRNK